jgi:elongation factor Ts
MANITAALVKELRGTTGAGMMDCKKALTETDGNLEEAIEVLRKNGQAKAAKKAGRIAAEGLVDVAFDGDQKVVIVEVNSETDFVAKNDDFKSYVHAVAEQALDSNTSDMDSFFAESWKADNSKTVKEALVEKISIIGENLNIRRFHKLEAAKGCVVSYIHGGGRIGVILESETEVVNDNIKEALGNIAMQIAALSPKYVSEDEISEEYKAHELEILMAQAKADPSNEKKPDQIIEKMVTGRLKKQFKEICLLDQAYVKDGDLTVAGYLDQVSKENNTKVSVKQFVRFETGEGIEKKKENFAEEVAAQMA